MKDTDIQALAGNIVHYVLADGQAEHCIEWVTKVLRAEFACERYESLLKVDPLWERGASKNPAEEIRRALDNSRHGLKAEYEEITHIPPGGGDFFP